jgi:V-type H+-transporting ATPase subunit D
MSTTNRLTVVPTVTVLAQIKNRLIGAQRGYKLLKKKADALSMRYRSILRKICQQKQAMGDSMRQAAFMWTEAKYAAGDGIKHTVLDQVDQADVRVKAFSENVAGVKIPKFLSFREGRESRGELTGLGELDYASILFVCFCS